MKAHVGFIAFGAVFLAGAGILALVGKAFFPAIGLGLIGIALLYWGIFNKPKV